MISLSDATPNVFKIKNGKKMKHPKVNVAIYKAETFKRIHNTEQESRRSFYQINTNWCFDKTQSLRSAKKIF